MHSAHPPLRTLLLGFIVLLATASAQEVVAFEHLDLERRAEVHLPSGGGAGRPLLIALHDDAGSGRAFAAMTDLPAVAERLGMIAAFPDSHLLAWDSGRSAASSSVAFTPRDDVGFLAALVERIVSDYGADPSAVHLVGLGDGGAMAIEVACKAPELARSIALVGAWAWSYQPGSCTEGASARPSVLMIDGNGPLSQILPPPADSAPSMLDGPETVAFLARLGGCDPDTLSMAGPVQSFAGCDGGSTVSLVGVQGAGRHWLHGLDRVVNRSNIAADAVIESFVAGRDWRADLPQVPRRFGGEPPRSYLVYVPSDYDPSRAYPLVMVLHGRPSNALGMAFISDMNPVAEARGFIAVYPDYAFDSWNYYRGLPDLPGIGEEAADDVAFLQALTDELAIDLHLDPRRLYVTGFSNGGFMTERLACDATDTFAAFAVVGAVFVPEFASPCYRNDPAPLLYIHGTEDVSIPWEGLQNPYPDGVRVTGLSASDSVRFWVLRNGCVFLPEATILDKVDPADPTVVRSFVYEGCNSGHPIHFIAVEGGGHNWPGVPGRIGPEIAGQVTMDFHASERIWEFFRERLRAPR
jgi:polyhydroxybutyrate depolymerase